MKEEITENLKEDIIEKWKKSGQLDGLTEMDDINKFKIFESNLQKILSSRISNNNNSKNKKKIIMELENKYTTIEFKTYGELNQKMNELNSEGWEILSVNINDETKSTTHKSANILLKKIKEDKNIDDNKQILND